MLVKYYGSDTYNVSNNIIKVDIDKTFSSIEELFLYFITQNCILEKIYNNDNIEMNISLKFNISDGYVCFLYTCYCSANLDRHQDFTKLYSKVEREYKIKKLLCI